MDATDLEESPLVKIQLLTLVVNTVGRKIHWLE